MLSARRLSDFVRLQAAVSHGLATGLATWPEVTTKSVDGISVEPVGFNSRFLPDFLGKKDHLASLWLRFTVFLLTKSHHGINMVQGGTTVGGPPCHVFPMIDLDHEMDWDDISLGLFFTLIVCQTISSHNYWPKANWLHHSSLILLAGLWMWLRSVYRPISGATAPPSHEVLIQTVIWETTKYHQLQTYPIWQATNIESLRW